VIDGRTAGAFALALREMDSVLVSSSSCILADVTGPEMAMPTSRLGEREQRWSTTRRAADLVWVIALLIAIPLSPVARWYLLTWPGLAEWILVVVIAVGIVVHKIAHRRLRAIQTAAAGDEGSEATPDDGRTPPRSHNTTVIGWMCVVLLLPAVWACLIDPFIAARSFDWGRAPPSGAFAPVLITTFLICPYLVGLLLWWLARGVRSTPARLIVAIVVACATGLLVYGSLGYLSPLLSGLL